MLQHLIYQKLLDSVQYTGHLHKLNSCGNFGQIFFKFGSYILLEQVIVSYLDLKTIFKNLKSIFLKSILMTGSASLIACCH